MAALWRESELMEIALFIILFRLVILPRERINWKSELFGKWKADFVAMYHVKVLFSFCHIRLVSVSGFGFLGYISRVPLLIGQRWTRLLGKKTGPLTNLSLQCTEVAKSWLYIFHSCGVAIKLSCPMRMEIAPWELPEKQQ